jgi:quercetin dioxygenase-like cupin family protein
MGAFTRLDAIAPQLLADGYLARALHGERVTMAIVEIDPGAELPEHRHDNEQLGLVVEGSVRFRVGEEERSLGPGEAWRIASNTSHSVSAGESGALVLDVFSPPREEWRALAALASQPASWPAS